MNESFTNLTTPLIADACVSVGLPVRVAPAGIRSLAPGQKICGRVCPVRHYGSVDVFLEALSYAQPGDVLVIDDAGRTTEACIGDLIALEAQAAGLSGIVVWGSHRDTDDILAIGLPVFSYGASPAGPRWLAARDTNPFGAIAFGDLSVSRVDTVFADSDGVMFVGTDHFGEVAAAAQTIYEKERAQAARVHGGETLREQFAFADYLERRRADPGYTFRTHLARIGGEVEK